MGNPFSWNDTIRKLTEEDEAKRKEQTAGKEDRILHLQRSIEEVDESILNLTEKRARLKEQLDMLICEEEG